jgi:hypothetical protein
MQKTLAMIGSAGLFAAFAAASPAAAMPVAAAVSRADVADVIQVRHHRRRAAHPRFVVRPDGYAYPDYYATYRGFEDPGFALRGNLPGCAVDLGYGRWESCDK